LQPNNFKYLTGRVQQVSESHDPLRRDVVDHAVVEPEGASPLDREQLDSLAGLDVEPWKVFLHQGRDVVAQDVRVPDDRRVVHHLTDAVDNENLR
jgi:hypothetical protein